MEELLAGAGMNGFLGVLETPVRTAHLEKLAREVTALQASPNTLEWTAPSSVRVHRRATPTPPSEISARVASAVLKVEELAQRIEARAKACLQPEGGENQT